MSRATAPDAARPTWTPARTFLLISLLYHLPLGIAGLLVDQTFPIGPDAARRADAAYIFGVFETNGWHSLAAALLAVVSLSFLLRPQRARAAALAIGAAHIVIFTALAAWPPETFWLASNAADQIVHAFTAVAGVTAGLLTPRDGVGARRQQAA